MEADLIFLIQSMIVWLTKQNENMTFNTTGSTVQKIGQDQQGRYEMMVGIDASKRG